MQNSISMTRVLYMNQESFRLANRCIIDFSIFLKVEHVIISPSGFYFRKETSKFAINEMSALILANGWQRMDSIIDIENAK